MNKKKRPPIPINLISGPLGVGKTTTINQLLALKPENEKWAILVNEYGLVGLDAAFMQPASGGNTRTGVDIREVAGGCICCSAGFMFEVSLVMLLQRRPNRLLIEPTGLAALSGILDTLERPGIRESVDVRSIICILDPKRFERDIRRDEMFDQVEAADVLLANRSDLATAAELESFMAWANRIFPPKRFVGPTEHGQIKLDLLDLISGRDVSIARAGHTHGTDHQHHHHDDHVHDHKDHNEHQHHSHEHSHPESGVDAAAGHPASDNESGVDADNPFAKRVHHSPIASTIGWICWNGLVFRSDRVSSWLRGLANLPNAMRIKAVVRTNDGWLGFNVFDGIEDVRKTGYRRDTRLEVIFDGQDIPDVDKLENALHQCLDTPPT
ncbi:MAG: CobW family GTP-binding protein [Myxococcota bacterium]|nr:CobW family GTP-binding protein [Myxococcota bacterium]